MYERISQEKGALSGIDFPFFLTVLSHFDNPHNLFQMMGSSSHDWNMANLLYSSTNHFLQKVHNR